ncbi:unnamed protein product [Calypogeia fissa]
MEKRAAMMRRSWGKVNRIVVWQLQRPTNMSFGIQGMSVVTSSTNNSSTNLLSGVKLEKSINDAGFCSSPAVNQWPWKSFRPSDTSSPNLSVDLHKHHEPKRWDEKFALNLVQLIKIPTVFCSTRAMMLETVAAVPGMVGSMQLHLRSLRRLSKVGDGSRPCWTKLRMSACTL